MSRKTRAAVEREASQLLAAHGIDKPPVNVERLARALGYEVLYQHLAGDVSGTAILADDGSLTIGINSFHASVRQRFSIAHEIGHAKLHMSAKSPMFVDPPTRVLFRDGAASLGEDPREIQANQYAAALLMPQHLIAEQGQRITDRTPEISVDGLVTQLAAKFEVSTQAMRYRLVTFGVVEPE